RGGIDISCIMHLISERRCGRRRTTDGNASGGVAAGSLYRVDLVREVRNVAILAARSQHHHLREIGAGTGQVVIADDAPGDAEFLKGWDDALAETCLRGEVTARD